MPTSLYILHIGPTVLGAYSTPSLLTEAISGWHSEFRHRFGRLPDPAELPKMTFVEVDKRPEDKPQMATGASVTEAN